MRTSTCSAREAVFRQARSVANAYLPLPHKHWISAPIPRTWTRLARGRDSPDFGQDFNRCSLTCSTMRAPSTLAITPVGGESTCAAASLPGGASGCPRYPSPRDSIQLAARSACACRNSPPRRSGEIAQHAPARRPHRPIVRPVRRPPPARATAAGARARRRQPLETRVQDSTTWALSWRARAGGRRGLINVNGCVGAPIAPASAASARPFAPWSRAAAPRLEDNPAAPATTRAGCGPCRHSSVRAHARDPRCGAGHTAPSTNPLLGVVDHRPVVRLDWTCIAVRPCESAHGKRAPTAATRRSPAPGR